MQEVRIISAMASCHYTFPQTRPGFLSLLVCLRTQCSGSQDELSLGPPGVRRLGVRGTLLSTSMCSTLEYHRPDKSYSFSCSTWFPAIRAFLQETMNWLSTSSSTCHEDGRKCHWVFPCVVLLLAALSRFSPAQGLNLNREASQYARETQHRNLLEIVMIVPLEATEAQMKCE